MVYPSHNVQLSTFKEGTGQVSSMSRSQTLHCPHYHALFYSSIQSICLSNRYFKMEEPKVLKEKNMKIKQQYECK